MYILYVVCLLHAFSETYQLSLKMSLNLDICTVLKFNFSEWEACICICVFLSSVGATLYGNKLQLANM